MWFQRTQILVIEVTLPSMCCKYYLGPKRNLNISPCPLSCSGQCFFWGGKTGICWTLCHITIQFLKQLFESRTKNSNLSWRNVEVTDPVLSLSGRMAVKWFLLVSIWVFGVSTLCDCTKKISLVFEKEKKTSTKMLSS